MRKPVIALVVGVIAVGLAAPSQAAAPKLAKAKKIVVKDAAGDANGINTQFGLLPFAPPAGPAAVNLKQADIVSFTLGRKDNGKKVLAIVGTMTMTGPPDKGVDYRIRMSAPGCSTYFLEFEKSPLGDSGYLRNNCSGMTAFDLIDAVVAGNTVTWTVPISGLSGEVKLGTVLELKGAQTNGAPGAVIFPTLDEVRTTLKFTVGQ